MTGVEGDKFLSAITIKNEKGKEQKLALDGVFIEIGWLPNTDMVAELVELNGKKEIVVDSTGRRACPGSLRRVM